MGEKDTEEFGRAMVKVKWGQPRNKGLMRAMEDAEKRKVIDKMELSFYSSK
jgi:preprotein translocase subunit SecA